MHVSRIVIAAVILLAGCAAPEDEQYQYEAQHAQPFDTREFTTDCGIPQNGIVMHTVQASDGVLVRVRSVAGNNRVIVETADGGALLVKLHGLDGPVEKHQAALQSLERYVNSTLLLFPAGDRCEIVVPGGGRGITAHLLDGVGRSVAEELVRSGTVAPTHTDPCGSETFASCLEALAPVVPTTAGALSAFLWKPVSDSDGKLAIHTGPANTIVRVNGETGSNRGPGNGYGSLARFSRPGCAYPHPRIEVIDGATGLPYTVGGATTFTVPDPCQRFCVAGERLIACPKR